MALDVYVWLAYRLHRIIKPTLVSWKALYDQFGGGFQRIRKFREQFREPLALALAAYPEANVEVDEKGVRMNPSAPPIPHRLPSSAPKVRTLIG
jgi:hypothetical protein